MKIYHRLILVIFVSIVTSQNSPYTIQSLPAYSLQRACVQDCVLGSYYGVAYAIGCPYPILNPCACRTDLQSSASTFLTSCVNQGCNTNPPDLSSAISLYDGYCSMNGYEIVGTLVTTTAKTTAVSSLATASPASTATVTAMATPSPTSLATTLSSTPSSTTTSTTILIPIPNSTSASSSNARAIAGGVVGGLLAIAIIVAIIFFIIRIMKRRPIPSPHPYVPPRPNPYYQSNEQTAISQWGSPTPPYILNAPPHSDIKTGPEIYEAAVSDLNSPSERTYGAPGEIGKA